MYRTDYKNGENDPCPACDPKKRGYGPYGRPCRFCRNGAIALARVIVLESEARKLHKAKLEQERKDA